MIRKNNKSLLHKYFISFFSITLIPLLLVGLIFYFITIVGLERSIQDNKISNLTQVKSNIDYTIQSYTNMVLKLNLNINSNPDMDLIFSNNQAANTKAANFVGNYEELLSTPAKILLYKRGSNRVFLSDGEYDYSIFESNISTQMDMTMIRFYSKLNSVRSLTILGLKHDYIKGIGNDNICFLYQLPFLSENPYASIGFLLSNRNISKVFENYMGELKGDILIYNAGLNLVYYSGAKESADIESLSSKLVKTKGSGVFPVNFNEKKQILMRIVSEESGLIYCALQDKDIFYADVSYTKNLLYIISILLVLCGLAVAFLLASHNYKPIKQLISNISLKNHENTELNDENELEFLYNTYQEIYNNNNKLLVQIDKQRPIIRDQCLAKLVQGKVSKTEDIEYYLQCSNLQLQYKYFFVISIVSMDPYNDISKISTYTEQIYLKNAVGYGVELTNDRSVAVIINSKDEISDPETKKEYAIDIINSTKSEVDAKLIVGIGSTYDSILKCANSFLEANVAIQTNRDNNKDLLRVYEALDIEGKEECIYPIKEQAIYMQSLRYGNEQVALEALESIIKSIASKYHSFSVARCICFDTINQLIKYAEQLNIIVSFKTLNELSAFSSLEDFRIKLFDFTKVICTYVNEEKEKKTIALKKEIINYIDTNYCQLDISLKSISNKFNISVSLLSRLIKEETGYTIGQYITDKRIEEVKRRLRDTDEKVKDIISDVGYYDMANFIRKFKGITNMTPGEYRTVTKYGKDIFQNS